MDGPALPADDVRNALEKVLASRAFAGAGRSRELLRYLIEALLGGRADQLKEYTVGAEGLSRGERFDPRIDSIARTEASRLRGRLELYYVTEGAVDPLVISLPKGAYVPLIEGRKAAPEAAAGPAPVKRQMHPALFAGIGALAAAVVIGIAAFAFVPRPSSEAQPREVAKFDMAIGAPGGVIFSDLSQDGRVLAMFVLAPDGTSHLVTRSLRGVDSLAAKELPGTTGAQSPFLSPDGKWVGFFQGGQIKKMLVEGGGSPIALAPFSVVFGAAWTDDGRIVLSGNTGKAIEIISEDGGKAKTIVDFGMDGRHPIRARPLPGGRGILFTSVDKAATARIEYIGMDGKGLKVVLESGSDARYLPSGHLVYGNGAQLFAVKFDLARVETVGTPWPILKDAQVGSNGISNTLAIADDGTAIYARSRGEALTTIAMIDERGGARTLVKEPGVYSWPRLSPDGTRLLYARVDGPNVGLVSQDIATGMRTPLTRDPGIAGGPVWSRDGTYVFYQQDHPLMVRRSDGTGEPKVLDEAVGRPWSLSPDGKRLAYERTDGSSAFDIWTMPIEVGADGVSGGEASLAFVSPATDSMPAFSPDGKWIAYASNEDGDYAVYVRRYPDNGQRTKLTTGWSAFLRWPKQGQRIFYLDHLGRIMGMRYRIEGDRFMALGAKAWPSPVLVLGGAPPSFDVTPDGKAVIAPFPVDPGVARVQDHLTVVQNFFSTLDR
ncbi:MAG TPA: hypothetical protein VGO52_16495 [Hyphomonadaceae bacterium]|jgi:serine/threonine-protein kinase|nr:hypothetical protein [Hyphomonadaceae bacterium]